jgi:hypothetical protein
LVGKEENNETKEIERKEMNEQQHELLNKYEEGLRKMVTEFLTQQKELEGQLLEVDELKQKWKSSAPS